MYGMYVTLHEADISLYVDIMNEKCRDNHEESMLKRLRAYAGLSQRALADKSGVPLRQIQLFEQGQRDITKTQGQTLLQLSRTLGHSMEDLL
jgi:plasmid maintenance system antidote protein VapI